VSSRLVVRSEALRGGGVDAELAYEPLHPLVVHASRRGGGSSCVIRGLSLTSLSGQVGFGTLTYAIAIGPLVHVLIPFLGVKLVNSTE